MINSYKCDRCGALYSNPTNESNKYTILRSDHIVDGHIDLCPKCQEQLRKWVENENENVHKSCSNCIHCTSNINIEPCFSCSTYVINHKYWEPKEDKNE